MKKLVLIFVAVLAFAAAASAQPRAVGVRATAGFEVSYQHELGRMGNFVEADLGYMVPMGKQADWFNIAAIYNFLIAEPDWTSRGDWGFYAGPGLALGAGEREFAFGLAGQIGLEYTFWFPLQLSFDFRPQLGYGHYAGGDHFAFWGWYPSLGVRYRF
ncbi:MAG: hypothetical protein LUD72_09630 [Bacteroidales bacterium]|nr:hypothetical protein [Bacteroidales bacterium]